MNENTITSTDLIQSETVQIPLTKGYFATIDREDLERVSQYKWTALKTPWTVYARRTVRLPDGRQRSLYLHRFLMEPGEGIEVDHKDGDGTNCVRSNMRFATKSQNAHNQKRRRSSKSGIKGVSFNTRSNRWVAYVTLHRVMHHLGYYKTKEEATAARLAAAKVMHKDFHKPE